MPISTISNTFKFVFFREDYNRLFDFVEKKGLKVRNAKRLDHKSYKEDAFVGSDDELDPYKEKLKQDARAAGGDDDESDSEDEDFNVQDAERKQQEEKDSSEGSGELKHKNFKI